MKMNKTNKNNRVGMKNKNTKANDTKNKVRAFRGEIWEVRTKSEVELGLIISNDIGNKNSTIITIARITEYKEQHQKDKLPTQHIYSLTLEDGSQKKVLICFEQQRTYADSRLVKRVEPTIKVNLDFYLHKVYTPGALKNEIMPNYNLGIKQFDAFHLEVDKATGSEQDGNRIVYVISCDELNDAGYVTVAPITSQPKQKLPTHIFIPKYAGLTKNSFLLAEHSNTLELSELHRAERRQGLPAKLHKKGLEAIAAVTAKKSEILKKIHGGKDR
ncbi:hypothetical protein CN918_27170 [Priestia megaterium]|nr:hypothetical protein CN918_27170 [Priestia megaterium]